MIIENAANVDSYEPEDMVVPLNKSRKRSESLILQSQASQQAKLRAKRPQLPLITTEFINRKEEFALLDKLFRENCRLVTIIGPPGNGKTRLAIEYCRHLVAEGGEVVFIDLVGATSVDDVFVALAVGLSVPLGHINSVDEISDQLIGMLGGQPRTLIVLDNCEHMIAEIRGVIETLLSGPAELNLLATSRERINVEEERVIELEPLDEKDAFSLFVLRAEQRINQFERNSEEDEAILTIVQALDGNPLAIELCAARINMFGPLEMKEQIPERFSLLKSRGKMPGARFASLMEALNWSWALLTEKEQRSLSILSVFRGGFTLDSATHVIDACLGIKDNTESALDIIEGLLEKSLIRSSSSSQSSKIKRFSLYESVRDFAFQKLGEMGIRDRAFHGHAQYFTKTYNFSVKEGESKDALPALAADIENLKAIYDRAMEKGPPKAELALRACLSMSPLYATRGPYAQYLAMIEAARSAIETPDSTDREIKIRTLLTIAITEHRRGDYGQSVSAYEEALETACELGDRWLEAYILIKIGGLLPFVNRTGEVTAFFERAGVASSETKDKRLEAMLCEEFATATIWTLPEDAEKQFERAIRIFREIGDEIREAYTSSAVCIYRFGVGMLNASETSGIEAMKVLEKFGDLRWAAQIRAILAMIRYERGETEQAQEEIFDVLKIQKDIGNFWLEAFAYLFLAEISLDRGQAHEAYSNFMKALEIIRPIGAGPVTTSWIYLGLGAASAEMSEIEEAAGWFEKAEEKIALVKHSRLKIALELRKEHLNLARAELCAQSGRYQESEEWLDQVKNSLAKFDPLNPESKKARRGRIITVRLPIRSLKSAFERKTRTLVSGLKVGPRVMWFSLGTSPRTSLEKRVAPRLILEKLIQEHQKSKGQGVSIEDLFASGWPGEKARPESASNRVYVTLTRLRKLGLNDIIKSCEGGFFIDPKVLVIQEQE